MNFEKKQSLGYLGALLGALLGGAAILLLREANVFFSLSGIILSYCTLKGFGLLGGKPQPAGMAYCVILILVMPYLADRVGWALEIHSVYGWMFGDAFLYAHKVIAAADYQQVYIQELLWIYAFAVLSYFYFVWQAAKKNRA